VRKTIKDRLIMVALVLAALLFALCFVSWAHTTLEASLDLRPWVHMTLEAALNLLWALLAFGALLHWVAPDTRKHCAHAAGLVTLVFVLSLLFPVISANDDLAQRDFLNDANTSQGIVSGLQSDKHLPVPGGLLRPAAIVALQSPSFPPGDSGFFSEPDRAASVATPGDTTGNHSPPLC
jgi:hypothetical protein